MRICFISKAAILKEIGEVRDTKNAGLSILKEDCHGSDR